METTKLLFQKISNDRVQLFLVHLAILKLTWLFLRRSPVLIAPSLAVVIAAVGIKSAAVRIDDGKCGTNPKETKQEPD